MSTSVPLWVPIVVAVLGFAGVISTQVLAGRREDRRWRRELEREELRWQREREREQDNRNYEGRAKGYGELIGVRGRRTSCGGWAPVLTTLVSYSRSSALHTTDGKIGTAPPHGEGRKTAVTNLPHPNRTLAATHF